jgi:hypothetical protein
VLFSSARRRNGFRALHDLAAGMRVVQVPSPFTRFRSEKPPPNALLKPADDWPRELAGYRVDGLVGRTSTGVLLQAHDADLDRSVWIHAHRNSTSKSRDARRSLTRPTRLRWLDSIEHDGAVLEVFEAPGGASFVECTRAQDGLEWPLSLRLLTSLCEELKEAESGSGAGVSIPREQLWVDRSWMLRVLDEPLDAAVPPIRAPIQFLAEVARGTLPSRRGAAPMLPPDLPEHAEPCARRIFGLDAPFGSISEAHSALARLAGRPDTLTRRVRGGQISLAVVFPIVCVIATLAIVWMSSRLMNGSMLVEDYARQLVRDAEARDHPDDFVPLSDDGRRARTILIAAALDGPLGDVVLQRTPAKEREVMLAAQAASPHPSVDDIAWARSALVVEDEQRSDPSARAIDRAIENPMTMAVLLACVASVGWAMLAVGFAFAFRGGLSLTVFGVRVRNRRGSLASRLRCAWRAAAAAVPLLVLYGLPFVLVFYDHTMLGYVALVFGVLAHAAWIAHAITRPSRSLQDRLAGTQLVPR